MLYVTTRSKYDAYTVNRTVQNDFGPDGGFYLPYRMPHLSRDDISALQDRSFGQTVAQILNLFFPAHLEGVDVDFCVGRYPVKIVSTNQKIFVGETWHNHDSSFDRFLKDLSARISGSDDRERMPSSWMNIAIRISVLFGLYGELERTRNVRCDSLLDIAVPAGDFAMPMAAWYAREMGLPVGNIVCACNDNSAAWDFLNLGELKTDTSAVRTNTPGMDFGVPRNLERLIYGTLGIEEAQYFAERSAAGKSYHIKAEMLDKVQQGIFASVVSSQRLPSLIPSVYNTSGYLMGPYTALAYGGVLDYRAKTGERRPLLLMADRSPACDREMVAGSMEISDRELKKLLDQE